MHVLLFDIDGTLLRSGGAGKAALETAFREVFGIAEVRGDIPYSGRTDRAIAQDLLRIHLLPESPENWHALREAYLRHLPLALQRVAGRILPGIAELLTALQRRERIALGLLTGNIRDGARIKLSHYGLYHHFPFGGFGDLHFCRSEVAREARSLLRQHINGDVADDRVWVIGDTPLDVQCARAIGAKAVAVATGGFTVEQLREEKPDLLFEDMSDPGPLLQCLC
jgi:phosphoglycolate phosphatase-like HAD superfamily hydrolase